MACPNTGAAPSVETEMTSGERLTIAPNWKSQNSGRSMTLTGTPEARAAAANAAASASSVIAPTAIAAPLRSAGPQRRRRNAIVPLGGEATRSWKPSASASAYTSTEAPVAASNSVFQSAASLPPATTARLLPSLKKTGNVAMASMRARLVAASGSGLSSESSVGIELDLGSGALVAVFAARVRLGKRYPRMSTDRGGRLPDDERVVLIHYVWLDSALLRGNSLSGASVDSLRVVGTCPALSTPAPNVLSCHTR